MQLPYVLLVYAAQLHPLDLAAIVVPLQVKLSLLMAPHETAISSVFEYTQLCIQFKTHCKEKKKKKKKETVINKFVEIYMEFHILEAMYICNVFIK